MTVVCGDSAVINGVNTMARWRLVDSADDGAWSASNIPGGVGRAETLRRVRVYYTAYGHTPAVFPGETLSFVGNVDGSNGVSLSTICRRVVIRGNMEAPNPYIIHEAELWNAGTTVTYGAAAASDATTPKVYPSIDMRVAYYQAPAWVNENDVAEAALEFISETREYASTDTNGFWVSVGGCRLDCRCQYRLYEGTPTNLKTPNTDLPFRLYVEDSDGDGTPDYYWDIENMVVRAVNGWEADHEGRKPVGGEMTALWDASKGGTGTGFIKTPGATPSTKWP